MITEYCGDRTFEHRQGGGRSGMNNQRKPGICCNTALSSSNINTIRKKNIKIEINKFFQSNTILKWNMLNGWLGGGGVDCECGDVAALSTAGTVSDRKNNRNVFLLLMPLKQKENRRKRKITNTQNAHTNARIHHEK